MPKPTAIYYFTNPNEDWKGINMKCSQKLAWKKKRANRHSFLAANAGI